MTKSAGYSSSCVSLAFSRFRMRIATTGLIVVIVVISLFAHSSQALKLGQRKGRRRKALSFLRYRKFDHEQQQQATTTTSTRSRFRIPLLTTSRRKRRPVSDSEGLHQAILDDGLSLSDLDNRMSETNSTVQELLQHEVVQLMAKRFHEGSKPGQRNDSHKIALCMEGGGMRGAVSAGMASAIACLGLQDSIDVIYGSSAGSIIGGYMVSRQMCVDVYTSVLPAAKKLFVCKKRLIRSCLLTAADRLLLTELSTKVPPGMNISFVLDGIMNETTGMRPLDMQAFTKNNKHQPLRVASSCVDADGNLYSACLGAKDFFGTNTTAPQQQSASDRSGLFACLQASMTVPGATGPPVHFVNSNISAFDAFCFEPLPYRSAVEEGATHVLVLRSRPRGFQAKTQPSIYETTIAPNYFRQHGLETAAQFFEKGGQQYLYLEDLMILEEGKNSPKSKVRIPPSKPIYGTGTTAEGRKRPKSNRKSWKEAHIMPIVVPSTTPELPTLENRKDPVIDAVRGGFAAAFDILAPAIGVVDLDGMDGTRVAELVFPKDLNSPGLDSKRVRGGLIVNSGDGATTTPTRVMGLEQQESAAARVTEMNPFPTIVKQQTFRTNAGGFDRQYPTRGGTSSSSSSRCTTTDARSLLLNLPGFQSQHLLSQTPIAEGLRHHRGIIEWEM